MDKITDNEQIARIAMTGNWPNRCPMIFSMTVPVIRKVVVNDLFGINKLLK
jgi:hypothetical protein